MDSGTTAPLRSPLHDDHLRIGAKAVATAGWEIPLSFAGVFQEYRASQTGTVVWDSTNLGAIAVTGAGAEETIQRTLTNDVSGCSPGAAQYTLLLSAADASVVDDLMVWRLAADEFILTANVSSRVLAALRSTGSAMTRSRLQVRDVSRERVLLAVQGKTARQTLTEITPEAGEMPAFAVREAVFEGVTVTLATTRFGARTGFELHIPATVASTMYGRLLQAGAQPAGLAMREVHRIEHGLPRHDHEFGPGITPLHAGLMRIVRLDTPFTGKEALLRAMRSRPSRLLRSVIMDSRRAPARGAVVLHAGQPVGEVTSGTFSLYLRRGVGLAYVDPAVADGAVVTVKADGRSATGRMAPVPAIPRTTETL